MKNSEAPVLCMYRISQPHSTSRMMYSIEAKASSALGLKCIVRKMPVTSWLTSTTSDRTPKMYQMLKFFGA